MTETSRSLPRRVLAATTVSAAVIGAGVPAPETRLAVGSWALSIGACTGLALFCLLARRRPRLPPLRRGRRGTLAAAVTYLTARSAYEELLWRGAILGLLLQALHAAPAIALSVAAWTLSHRHQGRTAFAHIATGSAFGGLYWATGALVAPIAAHTSYNLAVCFGRERARMHEAS